jgi:hypothetical protein
MSSSPLVHLCKTEWPLTPKRSVGRSDVSRCGGFAIGEGGVLSMREGKRVEHCGASRASSSGNHYISAVSPTQTMVVQVPSLISTIFDVAPSEMMDVSPNDFSLISLDAMGRWTHYEMAPPPPHRAGKPLRAIHTGSRIIAAYEKCFVIWTVGMELVARVDLPVARICADEYRVAVITPQGEIRVFTIDGAFSQSCGYAPDASTRFQIAITTLLVGNCIVDLFGNSRPIDLPGDASISLSKDGGCVHLLKCDGENIRTESWMLGIDDALGESFFNFVT